MSRPLTLASNSAARRRLLENAGLEVEVQPARLDEETIRAAMRAEGASPRELADALAEGKARKIAMKRPEALVLGCDQILEVEGEVMGKPRDGAELRAQLERLSGKTHRLLSAAVIYDRAEPVWRHIGVARMTMRQISPAYLDDYVARNWERLRHGVGGYEIEGEGVRLFAAVHGSLFDVQGLPLVEILSYLVLRGEVHG